MISVCIATYNGENYIRQQLMSILPQLSEDDEIVVSDDHSRDRTNEVILSINDPRIHLFTHDATIEPIFTIDRRQFCQCFISCKRRHYLSLRPR